MIIQLQKLLLILIRITTFISQVPGFSFKGVPNIFKVGLSLSFSLIVYVNTPEFITVDSLLFFFMLIIKEILIGMFLGLIVTLIFGAIEIAGQFVDFQSGFSMGSIFDPSMGKQASYYGRIYYWMSLSLFFILNLHIGVIESIIKSFNYIPIGDINFVTQDIKGLINLFVNTFEIAFNLAAPMVILVLITDIVLGIISKSVPQINVLMLGMPIKALVGYMLTFAMLAWLINNIADIILTLPSYINRFISTFN